MTNVQGSAYDLLFEGFRKPKLLKEEKLQKEDVVDAEVVYEREEK
ncbi:MAG: hypothetical protein ABIA92_00270 [Patescibacteria group bacterium]